MVTVCCGTCSYLFRKFGYEIVYFTLGKVLYLKALSTVGVFNFYTRNLDYPPRL